MKHLRELMEVQLMRMSTTGKLFRSEVTGDELWETYLSGFGSDAIFRSPESSVHNCNHCKNFIRRYGNIVAIDAKYQLMSMFDVELGEDDEFYHTIQGLKKLLGESKVAGVFVETFDNLNSLPYESCVKSAAKFRLGIPTNHKIYSQEEVEMYGGVETDKTYVFNHFAVELPTQFVDKSGASDASIVGEMLSQKDVFSRAMKEIPLGVYELVADLIRQGSLMNGMPHQDKVIKMLNYKKEFDKVSHNERENWLWVNSYKNPFAKFKNELIGVLCTDLASGVPLKKAWKDWNYRVDPQNYMKAVAPITESQKKSAQKFIEENGYVESFDRRYATVSDIKVSEILHVNNERKTKSVVSFFDKVTTKKTQKNDILDNKKIEKVGIDKFLEDILPGCSSVELYLENRLEDNMVTLTTTNNANSKPMFKWDNNYSWTYNGNLAGKSEIKERVKKRGGNVDGVLRFSLQWNESGNDNSDLDAWCIQPNGEKIGFNSQFRKDHNSPEKSYCGGQLDLDVITPDGKIAVENIYFEDANSLDDGEYKFYVNAYSSRNSLGFTCEIEMNGRVFNYNYSNSLRSQQNVDIATVTIKNGAMVSVKHHLDSSESSKDIYGLKSCDFHKVNLICLSPNHWDENGVGNKHHMFFLDGCTNPNIIRTFHVENLNSELLQHRKVMEIVAGVTTIGPDDSREQLSGVGFNATVRDTVTLRLSGTNNRLINVEF